MIDDIVEMILKEARERKGITPGVRLFRVWREINRKIGEIVHDLLKEERRKKEDENKG